jgi:signal transduction histidine kinase
VLQKAARKLTAAPIAWLAVILLLLATACSGEATPAVQAPSVRRLWETWWFWGVVALVVAAGAAGGYVLWVRSIEARTRELQNQVTDRTKELAALNAIAAVVSRSLDLYSILNDALDKTLEVMEIEAGGIYLLQEDAELLAIAAHKGLSAQFVTETGNLKVGEGLFGRVVQFGEPLVVRDLTTDPRLTRSAVRESGFRSMAISPLVSRAKVLGSLFVTTRGQREFSEKEVELLTSVGRQVGVAMENARLFEAEQRRAEQFRVLSEVGRRITSILPVDELLDQMAWLIKEAFDYYHVGFGLVEGDEVVSKVEVGPFREAYEGERLKVGEEGIWGWVAATGESLLVPDVSQEPRYYSETPPTESRSVLCVPLRTKEAVVGVLDVESDQTDAFDESDSAVLQSLADQAAIAIENAQLYEQAQQAAVVEERQRLARELHDSVTQALYGMTLYSKAAAGQLSLGHTDRVAEHLRELQNTSQEALAEMRLLIYELRPPVLEEEGLVAVLQARLRAVEGRAGVKTEFKAELEDRLPPQVEEGLYRIAQEALNNALRHAHARNITVYIGHASHEETVSLEVADDGVGFDPTAAREMGGLGLSAMEERAMKLGGRLTVKSGLGEGTRVLVEVDT